MNAYSFLEQLNANLADPKTGIDLFGVCDFCVKHAMRGALWYQGEANAGNGIEYRSLLPRLIGDWRKRWGMAKRSSPPPARCFAKPKPKAQRCA